MEIKVLIFLLLQGNPNVFPEKEALFLQSAVFIIPIASVLIFYYKHLFRNTLVRRATTSLFGALFVVFLHRWMALSNDVEPKHIILIDQLIIALGLANASPVLHRGPQLAIGCVFVSLCNHFYPEHLWLGSFLLALLVIGTIFFDIGRKDPIQ